VDELLGVIRRNPFIRIVIPFIIGIVFSLNFYIPEKISLLVFLLAVITYFILCFKSSYSLKNIIIGIIINVVLFSLGTFITQYSIDDSRRTNLINADGFIIGEVSQDTKKSEKSVRVYVDVLTNGSSDLSGKIILYLEIDSLATTLKPGDKIIFNPNLSEIQNKGNPEEFDYKKYLSNNLVYNSGYLTSGDWQKLNTEHDIKIRHSLLRFRTKLVDKLEELGLTSDELAVVSALALGYKDNLSNEIRHSYSSSGAMHILAVSGLHVGIVYGVLLFFLSFLRTKKLNVVKIITVIVFIWLYAMLTGLSPSVTRAATMFSIAAIGNLQKHKSGALNSVAASAFLLLIINPLNIVDVGFQLSYLAVIGIIVMQPSIYNIFTVKNKLLDKIWSLTSVSVAAQIATGPIAMYYFHQFSNYFILANYILIPVSTIAIWLCIFVFIFSGIGFIASFLTKLLAFVMKIMNETTSVIESMPYSLTDNIYINLTQLFIIYAVIILIFTYFSYSKKYSHFATAFSLIIVLAFINLYDELKFMKQKYIIMYNINRVTAINIIDGRDNVVFTNLDQIEKEKISFTAKNNWLKKGIKIEKYIKLSSGNRNILSDIVAIDNRNIFFKNNYIGFEDVRIFVLDKNFNSSNGLLEKINIDYLVLSDNPRINLKDLDKFFNFKELIIDSSNSNYLISKWLEQNIVCNYSIFNIKTDGAFILKL
jgi:competence protein ComEC